jgi:hypothetical protein
MEQKKSADEYSEAEAARRRDDAIRRALNTPPKPHKEMVGDGKPISKRKTGVVKSTDD